MEKLKIIVDDKGIVSVFMDGKQVTGKKSVTFHWHIDGDATHQIEYLTCVGKHEDYQGYVTDGVLYRPGLAMVGELSTREIIVPLVIT